MLDGGRAEAFEGCRRGGCWNLVLYWENLTPPIFLLAFSCQKLDFWH